MIIPGKRIHGLRFRRIDMDPGTKAAGDGLDGRKRIVDFMANHPDEALPRIALLLPQGDTYVRKHQERMRDAVLAKARSPYHPMHGIALARENHDSPIGLIEQAGKTHVIRAGAQGPLCAEMEDALRGRIDQPQTMLRIKGKHRRVHGRNHATQQGAGLELIQTLALQHVSEFVDLQSQLPQRIELAAATGAKRIIGLA